ncbi:hypothetical protein [Caproiciproducens galactitolivorans]|uniref:HK97 gp10 family phage protein n=1 Tax=Caproiciproducens galactitolivorans TaxID=642589 RepID=A0ABT4BYV7_9FIRM|nr:hypothetical protein [Caproiciproducens galactitolivorans]MCY1715223.1 hypothetical protein [Caproiciproducens galactitolivorans]
MAPNSLFSVEVKGLDHLDQTLALIIDNLPGAAETGIENALRSTADAAIRLAPGPVKGAIKIEILNSEGGVVQGRVYNDTSEVPWSSYTEFGTGVKVDNEGVDEAIVLKRATKIPWYIHVSMVPASFARYGYPLVTGLNGEKYWEVDGMYPKPYMKPAAFNNRERNVQSVADAISAMIREANGNGTS